MSKKILLIVIDDKEISKSLSVINTSHIYCDTNNPDIIKSDKYRFLNKIFLLSSEERAKDLFTIFPEYRDYPVYFIGTPTTRLPLNIEIYQEVNEPVFKIKEDYISLYTNREINNLDHLKNAKSVNLDIILTGKIDYNTSLSNLKKIVNKIKNNKIYSGFLIENVRTIYCGEKKELLLKVLDINTFIQIEEDNDKLYGTIKNTNLYNLINKSKYYHVWRGYYQVFSKMTDYGNLIMCLDISSIDPKCDNIDLYDTIEKILNDSKDTESIALYKDVLAIGTQKVMRYYMTHYENYGRYDFRKEIRDCNDAIIKKETYDIMDEKMRLRADAQLFEHIYHFGDLVMTKIYAIDKCRIKKKRLIIVTYYGIYEQFIYVKKGLELMDYEVYNFSYTQTVNEGGSVYDGMKDMINKIRPNYILWWVFNIDANVLYNITQIDTKIRHLYYNWDEPYNWIHVDAESKAKYLSSAFITCQETVSKYIGAGTLHAYCLYPGYSPSVHYVMDNIEYKYDVSFICTNLYENLTEYPDQIVNRKKIVEDLYDAHKNKEIIFALFGPDKFKSMFPEAYQGFIKYDDTCRAFNESKINLCTHVVGNKKGYLNERVFLILASGGLLLIDPIPGVDDILINGYNCIFINKNRIIQQVRRILDNYDKYQNIKKNAVETAKNYTWNDWAMRLEEKLLCDYN